MMRLWEFQNGKMGQYSSKIDRDTAKNVKIQILKNDSFCLKQAWKSFSELWCRKGNFENKPEFWSQDSLGNDSKTWLTKIPQVAVWDGDVETVADGLAQLM